MTYRHIKRGSLYDPRGTIRIQTDQPLKDDDQLVLYRAQEDGTLWGRPPTEFFDPARFIAEGRIILEGDRISHVFLGGTARSFAGYIRSVFWDSKQQRKFVVEQDTGALLILHELSTYRRYGLLG